MSIGWEWRSSGVPCRAAVIPTAAALIMLAGGGRAAASDHTEPPVEIYSRIARGALGCWFGAQGSLKKTHVFHADVASPSEGGGAEIAIYEKDPSAQNQRTVRAYRISIARAGEGSSVTAENFRMPAQVAGDLTADVERFAAGKTGCSVIGVGGWTAQAGKDEPPPPPAVEKKKKK